MKHLTVAVVVMALTGALAAFRGLARPSADAAPFQQQAASADAASDKNARPEAPRDVVAANAGDVKDASGGEKLIARLAADCAAHLYEKAKKQPDNVRLLEQAAAHYRACLSHEPTVEDGALFADARKNLEQIDRLLARIKSRETPKPAQVATPAPKSAKKPAEKAPVVAKKDDKPALAPAAKAKVKTDESLGVGPDGTVFRKDQAD